jgi:hypothetical protein
MGQDLVKDLVKNQYSLERIGKNLMWFGKDVASLAQMLPRQLRWMMRKFASNDFALEVRSPELEALREQMDLNGRRMSLSVLVAGLAIACAIALQHADEHHIGRYPVVAVIFFSAGVFFLAGLLLKSRR